MNFLLLVFLTTSFQALTVVRHCGYIPSPLIPGFHDFDALVKALPIFFTQVLWEIVQVCMQKMNFQTRATSKRFKTSQLFSTMLW